MPTRIFRAAFERLAPDALADWAAISVTIVSDISAGYVVVDPRMRPLPIGTRMVKQAVTARRDRSNFGAMLHAIDIAGQGEVFTVDAGG